MAIEFQRWDLHRIRRALKRAIRAEQRTLDDLTTLDVLAGLGDRDTRRTRARAERDIALWKGLDAKLERVLALWVKNVRHEL